MRALWTLPVALCSGCLASPPASTEADGGADCTRYEFDDRDGILVIEATGCRIETTGRLWIVQESALAVGAGCFAEPNAYFAVGSLMIEYGSESVLPVGIVVFRPGQDTSAALNRWDFTLEISERRIGDEILNVDSIDFDPSWTHLRLDFEGGEVAVSAGPSRAELERRMAIPFIPEPEMGVLIGSWASDEPAGEREASFDHLEICP